MITVLCPACPTSDPCGLCGDQGVVDQSLLYAHEPKIRIRPTADYRPVFEAADLSWFTATDWIRTRDLIAAISACMIAIGARLLHRCWT